MRTTIPRKLNRFDPVALNIGISMLEPIIKNFGIEPGEYVTYPYGMGLINHTWKVSGPGHEYILQKINKSIFKSPEDIASNVRHIAQYLSSTKVPYLFISPIKSSNGTDLVRDESGEYFRLTPFVSGSRTIDTVGTKDQAFEAARQFGLFTRLLSDFDSSILKYTLTDFHNLTLRFSQFTEAHAKASSTLKKNAAGAIDSALKHVSIVRVYENIIREKSIPIRVIHHDTKISNVLFNAEDEGLCVIDLDTVMPGYFISDLGDMMRTYLSPASEEEKDLDKVVVRKDFFKAIIAGYFHEMGDVLTVKEKELVVYAGEFIIYMQAIRFLTDYLNGNIYYTAGYAGHNLVRALNQFKLLDEYMKAEEELGGFVRDLYSAPVKTGRQRL